MENLRDLDLVTTSSARVGDLLLPLKQGETSFLVVDSGGGTRATIALRNQDPNPFHVAPVDSYLRFFRRAKNVQIEVSPASLKHIQAGDIDETCAFRHGQNLGLAIARLGGGLPIFYSLSGELVSIDQHDHVFAFDSWRIGEQQGDTLAVALSCAARPTAARSIPTTQGAFS